MSGAGPPLPIAESLRPVAAAVAAIQVVVALGLLIYSAFGVVELAWLPWAMIPTTIVAGAVTIFSARARLVQGQASRLPIPIQGWRRHIAVVGFVAGWALAMWSVLTGPAGVTERDGDRYLIVNHGEEREVSQSEWEHAANSLVRFGAGVVGAMNFIAAVYLTSPTARSAPTYEEGA